MPETAERLTGKGDTVDKYNIKVNILGRIFPLLVSPAEEERVRNAARLISEKIRNYRERFSVKDDLDLVVMCCLELATDNIKQHEMLQLHAVNHEQEIMGLTDALSATLSDLKQHPALEA